MFVYMVEQNTLYIMDWYTPFTDNIERLIKEKNVQKILFLENGMQDESRLMEDTYNHLNDNGYDVTFIEFASSHDPETLLGIINNVQLVIGETSFIRSELVYPLIKILNKANPLTIVLSIRGHTSDMIKYLESLYLWELEDFSKHELFYSAMEEDDEIFKQYDFKGLIKKLTPQKSELKDFNKRDKEFDVEVLRVTGAGSEFDVIKAGTNIQLINNEHPEGYFGAWVAGATEPVLLINFDGRHEWEYKKYDTLDKVLHYVASMSPQKKSESNQEIIGAFKQWVFRQQYDTSEKVYAILCKVDELMYDLDIPRRGNREQINSAFKEYLSQHQYFNKESKGNANPITLLA